MLKVTPEVTGWRPNKMPELPEVETVRSILEKEVQGKKIASVSVLRPKNVITPLTEFESALKGKTILSVGRKGKYLLFHLSDDFVLLSHLRMEGKYFLKESKSPLTKHDLIYFDFSDGTRLVYNDVRKFGVMGLYREENYLSLSSLSHLGKEPFEITPKELFEGLKKKKQEAIKTALLDQSLIAGIGNIYADETLFGAKLDPRTPCSLITLKDCSRLLDSCRKVMKLAIEEGGSTIKSYHPKEGMNGLMQNHLYAYGKMNTACPNCQTPFHRIFLNGRSATYCPNCQRSRLYPFIIAVTGPIHSGKSSVSAMLAKDKYLLISCDDVVSQLYQEKSVLSLLRKSFGKAIIKEGKLDRKELSRIIKNDPKKNKKLTSLIHPLVKENILNQLSQLNPQDKVILEVPLFVGSGFENLIDMLILVTSDPLKQMKRIEEEGRDASTLLEINRNYPIRKTRLLATYEIQNNGSIEELEEQINSLKIL